MFGNVCIIGVGFMGGSLALSLREAGLCNSIYGIDIDKNSIDKALDLGIIDYGYTDLGCIKGIELDIVIIATPVGTFTEIGECLKDLIEEDVIVTDIGSVKGNIVYKMESFLGGRFVGGHPIAGTEKSGVEYSRSDLYKGKKVIITPTENTNGAFMNRVIDMWRSIGSRVEFMDPFTHDYVFGAVSHLPHAVAFGLIETIDRMSKEIDLFKYPGAGFKDFTRIAASNPVMWRDIFMENSNNVIEAIDVYMDVLSDIKRMIEKGESEKLCKYLERIREKRLMIDEDK